MRGPTTASRRCHCSGGCWRRPTSLSKPSTARSSSPTCRASRELSERLARAGKEGAELLVDAINACFSELLADAWGNGGSLLKFGGDALLLWFDGPEHAPASLRLGLSRCGAHCGRRPDPRRRHPGRAADVGRHPLRLLPDVPGGWLTSGVRDRRPGDDRGGHDGEARIRGPDPPQPRYGGTAARRLPRSRAGPGDPDCPVPRVRRLFAAGGPAATKRCRRLLPFDRGSPHT